MSELKPPKVLNSFSNIQIDPNSTQANQPPLPKPQEEKEDPKSSFSKGSTFSSRELDLRFFDSSDTLIFVGPDESKKGSAKLVLHGMCLSKRWKPPVYDCCNVHGPSNMRLFTYKVVVEIRDSSGTTTLLECFGDPKRKKKAASEHAAEGALWYLDHVKGKSDKAASVNQLK
ncbi:unnamed protein product [Eruca vesicaria subsp. sativa]|uniref:DRBM domain-containing protein n=1 Tax=Eruca vesicaria subsp. sativa TaxID=29727 RepID=A0ABC8JSQ8_ERUVS|nr:unnamed protein product [Eruca vesicaria subsp. sativa]